MYSPEFQHLLDFLDSNPEYLQDMRTRLLMPDLIALPEQFAQLVGLVTGLSASLQAFAEATNHRLDALEDHAAETNLRLTSIETDVGVLKTDVSTLKEDVGTLKADVGTLKTDVGTLNTNVASLNGSDLENRARLNILNIAMNELALNERPCSARHWPRHRTKGSWPGHQRCRGSRPHHGAAGGPRPSRGHHHPRPPRRRQTIRTRRV